MSRRTRTLETQSLVRVISACHVASFCVTLCHAQRAVHGPPAHMAANATAGTSAGTGAFALDAEIDEILAWTSWGEEQPALQTEH